MERAHSNLQVGLSLALLLLFNAFDANKAGAQTILGEALANDLRRNVVRIVSRWPGGLEHSGFGFVVGERAGFIYIATADHVVRDYSQNQIASAPGLFFFQDMGKEYRGDLLTTHLVQTLGDVAVIRTQPPPGFSWRRDALARVAPVRGADVWFVGLTGTWFVPARSGAISNIEPNNTIRFEGLTIRLGTSGAPLIAQTGILGMIVTDADVYGDATPIEVIERAFRDWQYPWQLTTTSPIAPPPATLAPPATPAPTATLPPLRIPPTSPATPTNWISGFSTRDNRDIWLQDIELPDGSIGISDVDINECARQCTNNSRCVGFAYDRWVKKCYLKNRITELILDARSMIAVKKPAEIPNVSRTLPSSIETLRNTRVKGELTSSKESRNFPACRSACEDNLQCIAFNFLKRTDGADNCEMYKMSDGYARDTSVDGGYKVQSP